MLYVNRGLTQKEAEEKLEEFGPNEIKEQEQNPFVKFLKWLVSPITLMLLAAAVLSAFSGDFFNAAFIVFLVILNYAIEKWQEHKADTALEKLREHLSVRASVCRDGEWKKIDSRELVPDDLVRVFRGDVIPADAKLLSDEDFSANQSMITGESMPVEKKKGDELYSGSYVAKGEGSILVTKTGANTYFGKALDLVDETGTKSTLEKDTLLISRFLLAVSLVAVTILSAYFFFFVPGNELTELVLLDLSLLIAGIPIALPTVMALILHVGATELAKKKTVIRRLSALDDLASVSLLMTDKTGTLTKNAIEVGGIIPWEGFTEKDVIRYALATTDEDTDNPIATTVKNKAEEFGIQFSTLHVKDQIPADSDRKHATATIEENGTTYTVADGAPQVTRKLAGISGDEKGGYDYLVDEAAKNGFRVLGVVRAEGEKEENMQVVGILTLSDPLVDDAKEIITFLEKHGIGVKMQTGDNVAIARYTSELLSLEGEVAGRDQIEKLKSDPELFEKTAAFAEILPEDKLTIVQGAKEKHLVAVTGDGANDIPAVKAANVGIAVHNAVDALKGAADVVLLDKGIGVIKDAFIEARKVFARMYSYSTYRISESFRLIMTVFILGLVIQSYPLTPIQLILIAFLNDIPIISLAFNRVKYVAHPEGINVKRRFAISLSYGVVGILESLLLFALLVHYDYALGIIQTAFFLKFIISGHMLIFVAHTEMRWWKFLPSKPVLFATVGTAIFASLVAYFGLLMSPIPFVILALVWGWTLIWMQVAEGAKWINQLILKRRGQDHFVHAEETEA